MVTCQAQVAAAPAPEPPTVTEPDLEPARPAKRTKKTRTQDADTIWSAIATVVCDAYGITQDELTVEGRGGQGVPKARSSAIVLGDELGMTSSEMASRMNVSTSGVHRRKENLRKMAGRDPSWTARMDRLRSEVRNRLG